ncbi:MAG: dihydroorotate dehydrogenase [Anaeromusa sp.]|uniref:dihydroorotate dehydrogenase n=1 Tax=Anaeromusa sp. TaxID=1872520 RepID=UPI002B1EF5DB|nr:dihydroorotate dehydrogenase [Anaeromusa sp.]MEA4836024.1 dihydroorotate dehydrogenase [Anaeromusa sp.]
MPNPSMSVKLAGLTLKNPVMTASGTFGFGLEYGEFFDVSKLGAIVVKGTTLTPWPGNSGQRIVETPAGMLNSIGLENPGVDVFLTQTLDKLKALDTHIIVNISGRTEEEYALLAEKLDVDGVAALEVNISCPNVKQGGLAFGTDCAMASGVVEAVKACTKKPVIVKLSPNVTDIAQMAQAVEAAGADAISLINTLTGMAIDIHTWKPKLGNGVGGLSGPAVKPVAVRMVYQVAKAVKVPIIGMGGIMTADDAAEFLLAGATAVAVGTAQFVNPTAALEVVQGLETYVQQRGLENVQQMIGKVRF